MTLVGRSYRVSRGRGISRNRSSAPSPYLQSSLRTAWDDCEHVTYLHVFLATDGHSYKATTEGHNRWIGMLPDHSTVTDGRFVISLSKNKQLSSEHETPRSVVGIIRLDAIRAHWTAGRSLALAAGSLYMYVIQINVTLSSPPIISH